MAFITLKDETKKYTMENNTIVANDKISFDIDEGELVIILGESGAGKSTVLNMLGGMDHPTEGSIIIDGQDIATYTERQLTEYRRTMVGFVFQFYNLIPNLTAHENVELASQVASDALDVDETLKHVGLEKRMANFPAQLSGGEQQRVAIARALAKNPKLLLCDEPTGALDYHTGKQILKLLQDTARKTHRTVLIVTHNSMIAPMADKVIHLKDAQVKGIERNEHPTPVENIEW
ncbi:ABC transporter ATP-binding protein YvcR [Pediococcus damnosus]|uniref:ABC transporter ATP-binding protein YvcR n=1 Tax=Pediococcus damnosus TaxID=51663 RepID=A0A0R2HLU1_9LACO|nr:ABC transporter ATP-binding protein [Pediococcus damnosus]AMV63156.1 ABC transporter ATP-binding protein YvcR [Pediococcus damnosus]AMV66953.1 ABC transporter ATP-binding protein YvcR [Pediococcus damnosus]AMV69447.1 ABC transporter ATP-binding protein YvcR [Pediococcus damnosus]KJU73643.1 macrolide ABC transporter ATP-binding protein [Pediococcus damnosus LMG 28219]KRN53938.1 ABC transporter ATP-binding protein [Pediococcus damnosus]